MPAEAELTPLAAERVCREAAQKSFAESARSVNCDWGTGMDGKQIQRWSEAIGKRLVEECVRFARQAGYRKVTTEYSETAIIHNLDSLYKKLIRQ